MVGVGALLIIKRETERDRELRNPWLCRALGLVVTDLADVRTCCTVEVRSLHTPYPNTFKLSFSEFLTFNPNKNSLS